MKPQRITVEPIRYALRTPLSNARGSMRDRKGQRVRIFDASGTCGIGEALPLPELGTEDHERSALATRELAERCPMEEQDLDDFVKRLAILAGDAPAARFAFDCAAHDLQAQLERSTTADLLTARPARSVRVNAVQGVAPPDDTARAAVAARDHGYDTVKIKLGRHSPAENAARIEAVRKCCGDLRIRLDANATWTRDEAAHQLDALADFDIELIEQPVRADDLDALRSLQIDTSIPIAADESLATIAGREAFLSGDLASIGILKPMVLGGLHPAHELAVEAHRRGLICIVTTTFEGPMGTRAALELAAALPESPFAHGLASSEQIEAEFPPELIPVRGRMFRG